MSDILIKNMEMPDCCYGCPIVYDMGEGNYACPFFNGYAPIDGRRDDCPLVEVKPHGRLIDADELVGNISDTYCEECPKTKPIMCKACEYEDIMDDIENAPTVLEAST